MAIQFKDDIQVPDIQINGNNLGLNAFTSTTIPTDNNQLINGAGYVTSSGNTVIGTTSTLNYSGQNVLASLDTKDGVVLSVTTRTMSLGTLGFTGDTNANYITNNNQLANGAGYGVGTITGVTTLPGLTGGSLTGTVSVGVDYGLSNNNVILAAPSGQPNKECQFIFDEPGRGVQKAPISSINTNMLTNGAGFITGTTGFTGTIDLCDCRGNPIRLTFADGILESAESGR